MTGMGRSDEAMAAIDEVNESDPRPWVFHGVERPKAAGEVELAERWLALLEPAPSEALRLAVHAHHLKRWAIPRADYPEGRAGYLRWRAALKKVHAAEVGRILGECGYGPDEIERVQALVQKRGTDGEHQTFEDVLCLVFLESQFDELASRTDEATMVDVVRKTLPKMSPRAVELAGSLSMTERERRILQEAVQSTTN